MACVVVKNEAQQSVSRLSNLESPARTVSSVAIVHHHHAVHARAVPPRTRTRARDNHIITHIHSLASRAPARAVTRGRSVPTNPKVTHRVAGCLCVPAPRSPRTTSRRRRSANNLCNCKICPFRQSLVRRRRHRRSRRRVRSRRDRESPKALGRAGIARTAAREHRRASRATERTDVIIVPREIVRTHLQGHLHSSRRVKEDRVRVEGETSTKTAQMSDGL